MSKLTEHIVEMIRQERLFGMSLKYISEKYKISVSQVSKIVTRKQWDHI